MMFHYFFLCLLSITCLTTALRAASDDDAGGNFAQQLAKDPIGTYRAVARAANAGKETQKIVPGKSYQQRKLSHTQLASSQALDDICPPGQGRKEKRLFKRRQQLN
ncbi:hypothetical protein OAN22_02380, partial [Alphaproteobacteria bacterium]|nr:hypothetical protein [Alphaproteobacteria bacterium]